jgi:hypothetical protein
MDAFVETLAQVVAELSVRPGEASHERYRRQLDELVRHGEIGEWVRDYLLDSDIKLDPAALRVIERLVITAMLEQHDHDTRAAIELVRGYPEAWPVLYALQNSAAGESR